MPDARDTGSPVRRGDDPAGSTPAVGDAVSWLAGADAPHPSANTGVVIGIVSAKSGRYHIIESDIGVVLAVPSSRVSNRLGGSACRFTLVDHAYGGVENLVSGITGCRVGVVVWKGDMEAWTKFPGRYHCAHCGRKVSVEVKA